MDVWAWEFLRRNEEYRKFWIEKVVPFNKVRIWAREYDEELKLRFGVLAPIDPSVATVPRFIADYTYWRDWRDRKDEAEDGPVTLPLTKFHVAMVVDLRLSLNTQFTRLSETTKKYQDSLKSTGEIDPKNPRKSPKYRIYLRILDAKASGARRPEIEKTLFPNATNADQYRSKKFDYHLKEARRLRDSGYRALANL
jgi:hypothetical protein